MPNLILSLIYFQYPQLLSFFLTTLEFSAISRLSSHPEYLRARAATAFSAS